MNFKFLSLLVAIVLQLVVLLGLHGSLGVPNIPEWQAGAFFFFMCSFLFVPPIFTRS